MMGGRLPVCLIVARAYRICLFVSGFWFKAVSGDCGVVPASSVPSSWYSKVASRLCRWLDA